MVYNPREFVNRKAEVDAFRDLFSNDHRRIFLVHGPEGIGKSALLGRMRQELSVPPKFSVFVDFRDKSLDDPEQVIGRLQERIGGEFADHLDLVGMDVLKKLSGEALADLLSRLGGAAVGRVDIHQAQEIRVDGDIVGGIKIELNNSSITLPIGGAQQVQRAIERRLNTAFPDALRALVSTRGPVVFFFDHFELAKFSVVQWLRHHLLNTHLEAMDALQDIWIVVASREIPYADEIEAWDYVLCSQLIKPLAEEAIREYWVEKRGLNPEKLPEVLQECEGIPLLLFWMAKATADSARGDRS